MATFLNSNTLLPHRFTPSVWSFFLSNKFRLTGKKIHFDMFNLLRISWRKVRRQTGGASTDTLCMRGNILLRSTGVLAIWSSSFPIRVLWSHCDVMLWSCVNECARERECVCAHKYPQWSTFYDPQCEPQNASNQQSESILTGPHHGAIFSSWIFTATSFYSGF